MNKENSTEGLITSDRIERTGKETSGQVVPPYPAADKAPVVPDNSTGGTVAAVGPKAETLVARASLNPNAGSSSALLSREASEHFRTRWNEIQGKFVDEPRSAVQQADALVSDVIAQLTQMFAHEHSSLEGQWNQGQDVSSEDLRQALLRYRAFFNRLVVGNRSARSAGVNDWGNLREAYRRITL